MPGPTKQFNQTHALQEAMKVFWRKGYEATSMQNLVDAMGINRASMYSTFGDKHALYVASLHAYYQNFQNRLQTMIDGKGKAITKIQRLLEMWLEHASTPNTTGCLMSNSAVELGPHDQEIKAITCKYVSEAEDRFAKLAQQAIDEGDLNSKLNAQQFARTLLAFGQGILVNGKAGVAPDEIKDSVKGFIKMMKQ